MLMWPMVCGVQMVKWQILAETYHLVHDCRQDVFLRAILESHCVAMVLPLCCPGCICNVGIVTHSMPAFAVTRHFLGVLPGNKAVRVYGTVCNAHLTAGNQVWAEKTPCCLATTLASSGLPPGRDPHLGSGHAAQRRRASHLVQSLYGACKNRGQLVQPWR